jgi:hypothetical protein
MMAIRRRSVLRSRAARAALVAATTASLSLLATSGEPLPGPVARAPTSSELNERPSVPPAAEGGDARRPSQAPVEEAQARRASAPHAESPGALRVDLLQRGVQEAAARDVFTAHSWYRAPPPAPPQAPEPPPPPTVPPVPFTFVGTFEAADGKPVIYLAEGEKLHAVSEGDILNEVWRVEAGGVDQIVLQYLPLSVRQPLALGSAK